MIREMASDLAALEHVRATQPELECDAIARRAVDERLARLAADLEDRLGDAINVVQWQLPNRAEHLLAHRVTHIGRATSSARVCLYRNISVSAVNLQKQTLIL